MTYVGQKPATTFDSGIHDRFTGTTGTTVTLSNDIATENDIIVFVNAVKQDSTNYSVGGTGNKTLTLGGTLVSADIVEVHYLNKVLQSVNPTAGSVGLTQLSATGTASSSTYLRGDNSFAAIAGGLSAASQWRMTTTFAGDAAPIASNWEQSDSTAYANLGSAMTESSGIFTFPSTGFWFVRFTGMIKSDNAANRAAYNISATTNNSSYSQITEAQVFGANTGGSNTYASVSSEAIVDVTDTAQVKVRFDVAQEDNSNDTMGSSSYPQTGATFIKLGDT